jgi:hypothetical protein
VMKLAVEEGLQTYYRGGGCNIAPLKRKPKAQEGP